MTVQLSSRRGSNGSKAACDNLPRASFIIETRRATRRGADRHLLKMQEIMTILLLQAFEWETRDNDESHHP
jgi:hypothetical protein